MANRQSQTQVNIGFYLKFLFLIVFCGSLIQCSVGNKKADVPSGKWKNRMQEMSQVLVDVYPHLVSHKEFNNPVNRRKIQKDAERLASLAHNVNKQRVKSKLKNLDRDPFVSVVSNTLDRELHLAVEGLRTGKRDFSRAVLKNAASMCVRCHSRGSWGPYFVDWKKDKSFQKLGLLEKGELLAAVRRYDQAIAHYETILADKKLASDESYTWVKAANSALNVAVRAQQDPDMAEKIVNTILANKSLPAFQRRNAEDWRRTIQNWKKENPRKKESLLAKAEQTLKEAREKEDYWGDRSSYIHYLRTSALLHDFLRTNTSVDDQAKALFYLGQCYEVVAEMGIGDTNEFYYKACIKRSPHSKTAMNCYERLEQNILVDYSGRGTFSFPSGLMDHLRVLRDLASPVEEKADFGKEMFESK